jgi:hypothetical protein
VAVSNALETLKKQTDWITPSGNGAGTVELVETLLATDFDFLDERAAHCVSFGKRLDGTDVWIQPYGKNVLIAGASGSGKSTLTTGFLERLQEQEYQFLVIDPEGDYAGLPFAVSLGDDRRPPSISQVLDLLSRPDQNAIVNLTGVALNERPAFFETLWPRVQELRAKTGRPHWIVVDESHHLVPSNREPAPPNISRKMQSLLVVTLEPDRIAPEILSTIDLVIGVGANVSAIFETFCRTIGEVCVAGAAHVRSGQASAWFRHSAETPFVFDIAAPKSERRRHLRKYAQGELPSDQCFFFRGPEGKLNLKAQNLAMFLQLADGVDSETWNFHLHNGEIASWFRNVIKDPELATRAEGLEQSSMNADESRKSIRAEIEKKYILAV